MARTQPGSCPTPAPLPPRASAGHLPSPASPLLSPGSASSAAGSIPAGTRSAGTRSATAAVRPHSSRRCSGDPAGGTCAPLARLRGDRAGPTGHAQEWGGRAPRETSACNLGARRPPSRGAARRRQLSPTPWPAWAGRPPGWPRSRHTVTTGGGRLLGGAGYRGWWGPGAVRSPRKTSGLARGRSGREGAGCSARRPRARGADALCLQKELK